MVFNQRYIAYDKSGVYGPFVSEDTAFAYAQDVLDNGHIRPLRVPKPANQSTRPQAA